MYVDDPRTWADLICDEAPPLPAAVRAEAQHAMSEPRPDTLIARLLTAGEFTCPSAAERFDCWSSSVRSAVRYHPTLFVQVRARRGDTPALWRAKEQR